MSPNPKKELHDSEVFGYTDILPWNDDTPSKASSKKSTADAICIPDGTLNCSKRDEHKKSQRGKLKGGTWSKR